MRTSVSDQVWVQDFTDIRHFAEMDFPAMMLRTPSRATTTLTLAVSLLAATSLFALVLAPLAAAAALRIHLS